MNLIRISTCSVRKLKCSSALFSSSANSSEPQHTHIDEGRDNVEHLYDGHIPTSVLQKATLAIGSAALSLLDPARGDMIAVLGETTGQLALKKMLRNMMKSEEGMQILSDRPTISSQTVDLQYLRTLPQGTLADAYIQFLDHNGVTPDSRLPVQFVDDAESAYVMLRYRQVHDLVHTILGMPTNMLGEVAVKWIEAIQTELPMCIGGALFGPIRLKPKQRQLYRDTLLPWALRVGFQSKPLLNVYFEKRWEQSVDDLRSELRIETPPRLKTK